MIQIKHGDLTWDILFDKHTQGKALINNEGIEYSIAPDGINAWHILSANKSYRVELIEANKEKKVALLRVNGKKIQFTAHTQIDQLLTKMGISQSSSQKINELKSPMPGLVIDVPIAVGQTLELGQPIIILEAMKMENILKAPAVVTVKKIMVEKGKPVEKNEVLVLFE